MPQLAFNKIVFDEPTSEFSNQSQCQIIILETEKDSIKISIDVQVASKVADEKRKRNITVSHRFRQRRKEKKQEISKNISNLEAQIWEMIEKEKILLAEARLSAEHCSTKPHFYTISISIAETKKIYFA